MAADLWNRSSMHPSWASSNYHVLDQQRPGTWATGTFLQSPCWLGDTLADMYPWFAVFVPKTLWIFFWQSLEKYRKMPGKYGRVPSTTILEQLLRNDELCKGRRQHADLCDTQHRELLKRQVGGLCCKRALNYELLTNLQVVHTISQPPKKLWKYADMIHTSNLYPNV